MKPYCRLNKPGNYTVIRASRTNPCIYLIDALRGFFSLARLYLAIADCQYRIAFAYDLNYPFALSGFRLGSVKDTRWLLTVEIMLPRHGIGHVYNLIVI